MVKKGAIQEKLNLDWGEIYCQCSRQNSLAITIIYNRFHKQLQAYCCKSLTTILPFLLVKNSQAKTGFHQIGASILVKFKQPSTLIIPDFSFPFPKFSFFFLPTHFTSYCSLSALSSPSLQSIQTQQTMSRNPLFSPPAKPNLEIRNQSKEKFFAIKRSTKRLKISNIFSQSSQNHAEAFFKNNEQQQKNEDLFGNIKDRKQELASTICSDHYLTFRSKQPKRKKNSKMKVSNDQTGEEGSASESEGPMHPIAEPTLSLKPIDKPNEVILASNFSPDQFLFLSKIGEGTYSQVFLGVQRKSGFICSLKVLNKQKIKSLKVQENIFRQIKIHSFVNHPHITKLYGCFHDEKSIYLICEYATDENVYEHLTKNKLEGRVGLPEERVSLFVGQICSALNYMHTKFIIHRDIKPENMILTYSDTIKICDFGWSVYNPSKELRSTFCGTPLYLAPELINSDSYNESVDIWALGVLTYELLTNQIPFKIRSIKDLKKVVSTEIKYTKIRCKQAVEFIENALRKDQEERMNIQELYQHPFLRYFHQQKNM